MVDDRSPTAKALSVVSQITTIACVAALPFMGGYALDGWLGTKPVFVLIGGLFGMVAAGFQLTRLVKHLETDNKSKPKS